MSCAQNAEDDQGDLTRMHEGISVNLNIDSVQAVIDLFFQTA